jgi:hypothetical protein
LKRRLKEALPEEFLWAMQRLHRRVQGQFRFHILIRGEAIMR